MDVVSGILFIGAIIAGATEGIKLMFPARVQGFVTIVVAVLIGILYALLDTHIGAENVTVASGIMIALGAAGVVGTAKKIG